MSVFENFVFKSTEMNPVKNFIINNLVITSSPDHSTSVSFVSFVYMFVQVLTGHLFIIIN